MAEKNFKSKYEQTEIGQLDKKIHDNTMKQKDITRLKELYSKHKTTSSAVKDVYTKWEKSLESQGGDSRTAIAEVNNETEFSRLSKKVADETCSEEDKTRIAFMYHKYGKGSSIAELYDKIFPTGVNDASVINPAVDQEETEVQAYPLLGFDSIEGLGGPRLQGEEHSVSPVIIRL